MTLEKIVNYKMSSEEMISISSDLDIHHSIFYAFWSSVRPIFSNKYPTAAVGFDKIGKCIEFMINPDFWEKSSQHRKLFILAHEMLHVILAHGERGVELGKDIDLQLSNIAADLCVNPMLVNSFGFNRELINDWEMFLWPDTFPIPIPSTVLPTYEGYYNFLIDLKSKIPKNLDSFDDHSGLNEIASASEEDKEAIKNSFTESMKHSASPSEIKDFVSKVSGTKIDDNGKVTRPSDMEGGFGHIGEPPIVGNLIQYAVIKSVKIKKKWEEVIKKWTSYILGEDYEYQWATEDRRFSTINSSEDILIPQLGEIETKIYEKIDILFFLDTSGSCGFLRDRFFKAAMSLSPKKFNVRLFSRTTVAKEIKIEDVINLTTNGSDRFQCMEDLIQGELASGKMKRYPEAVFHLTDGVDCAPSGDELKPLHPERWHFFMPEAHERTRLPAGSHVYMLKDYE